MSTIVVILAAGCAEDPPGTFNPPLGTTAGVAAPWGTAGTVPGTPPNGAAGTGAAGFTAIAGTGVAGRGVAGAGGTGLAGTGAAGTGMGGTGVAGTGVGGTGVAGAGTAGAGTAAGATAPGTGTCCPDGNCLCHGPAPTALTSAPGPYKTAQYRISTGTVVYPTDAEPPFAAVALCAGFLNTGPEMASWGPLYASHGIVTIIVTTGGGDLPALRATKLLAAVKQLKAENTVSSSPLAGKLSDRFGTSGYSMGGGGTTIASGDDPTLKTSVGLAAFGGSGSGVKVPTLLLCGTSDSTAPCSMSQGVYRGIAETTTKMMLAIPGANHFSWFGPGSAGGGLSGKVALAFQKVFLEGDERWRPLLVAMPSSGTQTTNLK